MTITTHGTVYGDTIKLDGAIDLPEGSRVTVRVEGPRPTREEQQRALEAFAAWGAEDQTFIEALEQVVRERRRFAPREPKEIDLERMRQGFERGFGACKDDPSVAEVFEQIDRQRHAGLPRELDPLD